MSPKAPGLRVLLLSNLYPLSDRPGTGTFIEARIAAHRSLGNTVLPVAITHRYPRWLQTVLSTLGRQRYEVEPSSGFVSTQTPLSVRQRRALKNEPPSTDFLKQIAASVLQHVGADYDIIHAHGMYLVPAGMLAEEVASATDKPYVVTVHGSDINNLLESRMSSYSRTLGSADAAVGVSPALTQRLGAIGVPADRRNTIPNGIDPSLFWPAPKPGRYRVAFVGNLVTIKGADRLPRIMKLIKARLPDAEFEIAGTGVLKEKLQAQCRGLPVTFHGAIPQEDVAALLRRANLLIVPSRNEGWPTVILEAHASGTPVLAARVGGTADAIGDLEFTVPECIDFETAFAKRALRILDSDIDPTPLVHRAARYSWSAIAEVETALYRRTLATTAHLE